MNKKQLTYKDFYNFVEGSGDSELCLLSSDKGILSVSYENFYALWNYGKYSPEGSNYIPFVHIAKRDLIKALKAVKEIERLQIKTIEGKMILHINNIPLSPVLDVESPSWFDHTHRPRFSPENTVRITFNSEIIGEAFEDIYRLFGYKTKDDVYSIRIHLAITTLGVDIVATDNKNLYVKEIHYGRGVEWELPSGHPPIAGKNWKLEGEYLKHNIKSIRTLAKTGQGVVVEVSINEDDSGIYFLDGDLGDYMLKWGQDSGNMPRYAKLINDHKNKFRVDETGYVKVDQIAGIVKSDIEIAKKTTYMKDHVGNLSTTLNFSKDKVEIVTHVYWSEEKVWKGVKINSTVLDLASYPDWSRSIRFNSEYLLRALPMFKDNSVYVYAFNDSPLLIEHIMNGVIIQYMVMILKGETTEIS